MGIRITIVIHITMITAPIRPFIAVTSPNDYYALAVWVQKALARRGYYHGPIDGVIGKALVAPFVATGPTMAFR